MSAEQPSLGSGPVLAGGAGDDLELDREEWAAVCPREFTPEQWRRFEGYMLEIFTAMGMPAGTVSTAETAVPADRHGGTGRQPGHGRVATPAGQAV